MAQQQLPRILASQMQGFWKNPKPFLLAISDEKDMRVWYFMVSGLESPFVGGEFIFKLTAPNEFPQKPPSFEFVTPNGVYEPGGKICISIGEYHAEDSAGKDGAHGWRPVLGMAGFAEQVVNGMICYEELTVGGGIRILQTGRATIMARALTSREWNRKNCPALYQQFEEAIASRAQLTTVKALLATRDLLANRSHAPLPSEQPALRNEAPERPASEQPAGTDSLAPERHAGTRKEKKPAGAPGRRRPRDENPTGAPPAAASVIASEAEKGPVPAATPVAAPAATPAAAPTAAPVAAPAATPADSGVTEKEPMPTAQPVKGSAETEQKPVKEPAEVEQEQEPEPATKESAVAEQEPVFADSLAVQEPVFADLLLAQAPPVRLSEGKSKETAAPDRGHLPGGGAIAITANILVSRTIYVAGGPFAAAAPPQRSGSQRSGSQCLPAGASDDELDLLLGFADDAEQPDAPPVEDLMDGGEARAAALDRPPEQAGDETAVGPPELSGPFDGTPHDAPQAGEPLDEPQSPDGTGEALETAAGVLNDAIDELFELF